MGIKFKGFYKESVAGGHRLIFKGSDGVSHDYFYGVTFMGQFEL